MPLDQNPHQTVTRFECFGFSLYACGFSVPQMLQFCLFTYPQDQNELHLSKFLFAKIGIFCTSICRHVSQLCSQPYSFGGRIKLIICQIRHVAKETLDGGPYILKVVFKKVTFYRLTYVQNYLFAHLQSKVKVYICTLTANSYVFFQ